MKHAEIKIGEMVIPLIGIPVNAVEEKCDFCGVVTHFQAVRIDENGKFKCKNCDL
jgi:hypothetical protein